MKTYWHKHYIAAALDCFPEECAGHDMQVGWKVTLPTGESYGGYYWPLVNGYHDTPVLHECDNWDASNYDSCPGRPGDGLCLLTDGGISEATSGVVRSLGACTGHVLVYPADLARTSDNGKHRVPFVIDVDCFEPVDLIRKSMVAHLQGAHLQDAYLRGADLRDADLRGAYLQDAYLRDANLRGADLRGADLRGAYLRGADLRGAYYSMYTFWPTGLDPVAAGAVIR